MRKECDVVGNVNGQGSVTVNVANFLEFKNALLKVEDGSYGTRNVTINVTGDLVWHQDYSDKHDVRGGLPILSRSDMTLTINGNDHLIDGLKQIRGLMVTDGSVVINDLLIENMIAKGGDGGTGLSSGGGGAGLGAGLYVGKSAEVTLNDVFFRDNAAIGGNGGLVSQTKIAGGGGGGMGGNGWDAGGDYAYSSSGALISQRVGGGGGGGGINDYFRAQYFGSNGLAYTQASGGDGGGQIQSYEKQFSLVGFHVTTESGVQVVDGPMPGTRWGGPGAQGGTALSGGGGGGIGGGASAPYFSTDTAILESFPLANLVSSVVVGLIGGVFPPFAFVAAGTQLTNDIIRAVNKGTWTPAEIAGITLDVLSFASAAKTNYTNYQGLVGGQLNTLLTSTPSQFATSLFVNLAVKPPAFAIAWAMADDVQGGIKAEVLNQTFSAIRNGLTAAELPRFYDGSVSVRQWHDLWGNKGDPTAGADGGWGGGGGGGASGGGDGGWGGGGGGGGVPVQRDVLISYETLDVGFAKFRVNEVYEKSTITFLGGDGGYGGGGGGGGFGARGGTGGFGAGNGTDGVYRDPVTGQIKVWPGQGGGGLGAGGAVFVEQGAKLVITGNSLINNNFAAGGIGINAGEGLGHDFFIQGNQTLTFNPTDVMAITGGIADEAGLGDSRYRGVGNVEVIGQGAFTLGGVNSFTGTLTIGAADVGARNDALADTRPTSGDAVQVNGWLDLPREGRWHPAITVIVHDGARMTVDKDAAFEPDYPGDVSALDVDMSRIGAGDFFDLSWDYRDGSPNINLFNWSGGAFNSYATPDNGDRLGFVFVDAKLRLVTIADNDMPRAAYPGGPQQEGRLITLLGEGSNTYRINTASDMGVIDAYLTKARGGGGPYDRVNALNPYAIEVVGNAGDADLRAYSAAGGTTITFKAAGYTGDVFLLAENGNALKLALDQSAFTLGSDGKYRFGGTIHDMASGASEYIDLNGLSFGSGVTVTRNANSFSISNGTTTNIITLGGDMPQQLWAAKDSDGSTLLFRSEYEYLQYSNPGALIGDWTAGLHGTLFSGDYKGSGSHADARVDIFGSARGSLTLDRRDGQVVVAIHGSFDGEFGFGRSPFIEYGFVGISVLELDAGAFTLTAPNVHSFTGRVKDFGNWGTLDLDALTFRAAKDMSFTIGGGILTVSNGIDSYRVTLTGTVGSTIVLAKDVDGSTLVFNSLDSALWYAGALTTPAGTTRDFTLVLPTQTIGSPTLGLVAQDGVTLHIAGMGSTLDGNGGRGLFVAGGDIVISDLTIVDTVARGGTGGFGLLGGGGGGAGMGGGLFVSKEASVTLDGVSFGGSSAIGGRGGTGALNVAQGNYLKGGAGGGIVTDANGEFAGRWPLFSNSDDLQFFDFGGFGGDGGSDLEQPAHSGTFGAGGGGGFDTSNFTGGSILVGSGIGGYGGGGGGSQLPELFGPSGNYPGYPSRGGLFGGNGQAGGGGGAGLGGNIVVQPGGHLTIAGNGTLAAGSVVGGAGGSGSWWNEAGNMVAANGAAGQAHGSNIFLPGTQTLSFAPGAGRTLTVAGGIVDERSAMIAGGYPVTGGGSGSLAIGAGTTILTGANSFTGGTTIQGGTLVLGAAGAAGSGRIAFSVTSAEQMLVLSGSAVPADGGSFANTITAFDVGDRLALSGVAYSAGASATISGSILTVVSGTYDVRFTVSQPTTSALTVFSDGRGGILVSVDRPAPHGADAVVTLVEDSSRALQAVDFGFSSLVADTLGAVRIVSLPATGRLLLNGQAVAVGAVATAAEIAAGKLVYAPPANGNGTALAHFDFELSGAGAPTLFDTDPDTLTFTVTPANDAPTITGPASLYGVEGSSIRLSLADTSQILVGDVDGAPGDLLTVSISVQHGTLTLASLANVSLVTGDGTADAAIVLRGTAAAVNAALEGLIYAPAQGFAGADTLQVRVTEPGTGGLQSSAAIPIDLGALHRAPLPLTGTAEMTVIDEDVPSATGTSVGALFAAAFDRSANGGVTLSGIAVAGSTVPTGAGVWQYLNGSSWVALTGASLDKAVLLDAATKLRFLPGADYNTANGARPGLVAHLIDSSSLPFANGLVVDITDLRGGQRAIAANPVILSQTVAAIDDVALARNDAATTLETTVVSGNLFLDNGYGVDLDTDGPALAIDQVNGVAAAVDKTIALPSGARLTVKANGDFAYDPNHAFDGLVSTERATASGAANTAATDSFTYRLSNGNVATVTITVRGVDSPGDRLVAPPGAATIIGSLSDDVIILTSPGNVTVSGGAGNDGFFFGSAFDGADVVDGGAGALDQIGLQGNYTTQLALGANTIRNVEMLVFLPGSDTRFGAPGNQSYSYNIKSNDGNVAAGQTMVIQANTLRVGETLTFDGSSETDGTFTFYAGYGTDLLTGGQKDDGFYFGQGRFTAGDRVDGQGGTMDQIGLQGDYSGVNALVFGATQMTGIEGIVLLSGADTRFGGGGARFSYTLTMNDGNATGTVAMLVQANALRTGEILTLDASAETSTPYQIYGGADADRITGGGGNDIIWGRGGADVLRGGRGNDIFAYQAGDSTATSRDTILDFTDGDRIDLSRLNISQFTGTAAFANSGVGQVRVTSVGGNDWLVEGDVDGNGTGDLAILVTAGAAHAWSGSDFTLASPPSPPPVSTVTMDSHALIV
ncbi:MAG: autotransporter-associated beta strand repeat-containing protein [Pseudomonadota bacterium]